jgi:hypothetical protein
MDDLYLANLKNNHTLKKKFHGVDQKLPFDSELVKQLEAIGDEDEAREKILDGSIKIEGRPPLTCSQKVGLAIALILETFHDILYFYFTPFLMLIPVLYMFYPTMQEV